MSKSRTGRAPAVVQCVGLSTLLSLLCLASAGCGSNPNDEHARAAIGAEPHRPRYASEASGRTDVEGDGLEAQVPPPPSIRVAPDDPMEPFSPNYGARPASAPAAAPLPRDYKPLAPPNRAPSSPAKVASAMTGG